MSHITGKLKPLRCAQDHDELSPGGLSRCAEAIQCDVPSCIATLFSSSPQSFF